ncbi:hypothetical protein COV17_01335 [Candidatus Woesearchaeota archaeon CG10_big_fil_rev_8_21_14_0_10_36_11]|nr:MAG: hypothetical protein COV17_01335 [Candidatus Woesearchaeota archaeon CG10_big_fil_rev_8_21_14_0_10_36_11]
MQPQQQLTEEQQKQLEEKIKNMSPEELQEFQKQQCIFCQIIAGKIPSKKVYEDETCITILDVNPAAKGHVLVIPKEHYAIMPQIPDTEIGHLFRIAQKMSQVILKSLQSGGTSIFVANGLAAGQRVQHFMIHIIPRKDGDQVLDLKDKVIDKELVHKVQSAVENKLNEHLGVKKEVVDVEKHKLEPVKKSSQKKKSQSEEKDTPEKDLLDTEEDEIEEAEEAEGDTSEEPKEKYGDVGLDDIANLFK